MTNSVDWRRCGRLSNHAKLRRIEVSVAVLVGLGILVTPISYRFNCFLFPSLVYDNFRMKLEWNCYKFGTFKTLVLKVPSILENLTRGARFKDSINFRNAGTNPGDFKLRWVCQNYSLKSDEWHWKFEIIWKRNAVKMCLASLYRFLARWWNISLPISVMSPINQPFMMKFTNFISYPSRFLRFYLSFIISRFK